MRKYILFSAVILLFSCKTLRISENRNEKNVKSIGVEWIINDDINPFYKERLAAEFDKQIAAFNAENHTFNVHRKEKKEKDYITVNFNKGRVVSKGVKIIGYTVTAIGMIATPILLLSLDPPGFALFYFAPSNKLYSHIALSPSLAASNNHDKILLLETNTLFANTNNQAEKLVSIFGQNFHAALEKIQLRILANK